MWLYVNPNGTISTCIERGEPARQGDELKVWLCFPNDDKYKEMTIKISTKLDSNIMFTATKLEDDEDGSLVTFHKMYPNEVSYDFKDHKEYICYKRYLSADALQKYGTLPLVIETVDRYGELVIYLANVNVQKTYGNHQRTTLSNSEYNNLLREIHDGISNRGKLSGDNEWTGENKFAILPSYLGNYDNVEPENLITKEYLDKNALTVVYATFMGNSEELNFGTMISQRENIDIGSDEFSITGATGDVSALLSEDKHIHLELLDSRSPYNIHLECSSTVGSYDIPFSMVGYLGDKMFELGIKDGQFISFRCTKMAKMSDLDELSGAVGHLGEDNIWTGSNTFSGGAPVFNSGIFVKSASYFKNITFFYSLPVAVNPQTGILIPASDEELTTKKYVDDEDKKKMDALNGVAYSPVIAQEAQGDNAIITRESVRQMVQNKVDGISGEVLEEVSRHFYPISEVDDMLRSKVSGQAFRDAITEINNRISAVPNTFAIVYSSQTPEFTNGIWTVQFRKPFTSEQPKSKTFQSFSECFNFLKISKNDRGTYTINGDDAYEFGVLIGPSSGFSFKPILGDAIPSTSLVTGDNILITDTEVPDLWVYKSEAFIQFFPFEVSKVNLKEYVTKAYLSAYIKGYDGEDAKVTVESDGTIKVEFSPIWKEFLEDAYNAEITRVSNETARETLKGELQTLQTNLNTIKTQLQPAVDLFGSNAYLTQEQYDALADKSGVHFVEISE